MNKLNNEFIQTLIKHDKGNVISIYLPTHRHASPPFMQEDQTRFKNNVRLAQEKWVEAGGSAREITKAMNELEALGDNLEFWQHTTEALAIFIKNDKVEILHLPIECEERVVVGDVFDAVPLLVTSSLNQPYYLLALAQQNPKVFKGDIYGLEELDVELPESLEEALNIDETHISSRALGGHQGGNVSSPHGEGDSEEIGRDERLRYFRVIEQALLDSEKFDSKLPVVLAAAENEAGDFRVNTKLQTVLQGDFIQGNHTDTSEGDLHDLARPIIHKECVKPKWQQLSERLGNMTGTGKSSSNLAEILAASKDGRVDSLVVGTLEMTLDSVSDAVSEPSFLLRRPDEESLDQIVEAARYVASQGGVVYGVERGVLPEGVQAAALYRY